MEETTPAVDAVVVVVTLLIFFTPVVIAWLSRRSRNAMKKKLATAMVALKEAKEKRKEAEQYSADLDAKYKPITDMEQHARLLLGKAEIQARTIKSDAERVYSEAEQRLGAAKEEASHISIEAKAALKDAKLRAEQIEADGRGESDRMLDFARRQAEEVAGDALAAKGKADLYEATVVAMRNTIQGYKDDYIIPNHAVLDELADEYSHKEAGEELKRARKRVRDMVKNGYAGACDYAEANRRAFAIHFAVDAFNGKVDSALAKVKHDNYGKIKQEVLDAFALVNHNGMPFRNARINQEYLEARLDELQWAVATHELRQIEREEQRAIREQMREEEKARREMEKAIKEAEKEERMLQKALEAARKELASAHGEQRAEYEAKLAELEIKLGEAESRGQRALSMAQQTKRGHVYVISNIGSFGENVFKIGMTRRLEPTDRVKELGDASVPFDFDVHAMIYSDDAPALEKALHRRFDDASVNKVNHRKEFFNLNVAEIRQAAEQQGMNEIHWTMKAEAAEYRESLSISRKQVTETPVTA
ncbi:DUF4041 domain-containing protein [Marinobacter sp. AC-23]|uniref:DUF4041 domain-containing protein n=1 Tax=Marinobacter sp. AC-23 TaxID=1879031 RepID=UPI0008DCA404|nr:DUF4041 domain-containing protein [Marinobacter sp. AC-23]OHY82741.1 ATPase [Marinobacter sp. AC-23]